jgi:hypothetical protein
MRAVVAAYVGAMLIGAMAMPRQDTGARWYRGNTHTHTLNSDGDSPPDVVARWYRERGYQFLFITDHEFITDVGPLNALVGAAGRFLVISGQEVTQRVRDTAHADGVRQAHVNALGLDRVIRPIGERNIAQGTTIAATYARNLPLIRAAGGVAQVNHPNYRWSVHLDQLLAIPDSALLEIWNGHPTVYNDGGTDSTGQSMPSAEALWDSLLTRGKLILGVADDDSHHFRQEGAGDPDQARPGRGWIMVRADSLTRTAILAAIARGDFYASTGVTLSDYRASPAEIVVTIAPDNDRRYRTEFIGRGGQVLATSTSLKSSYRIRGSEGYVRARVIDSSGRRAWTQPARARR